MRPPCKAWRRSPAAIDGLRLLTSWRLIRESFATRQHKPGLAIIDRPRLFPTSSASSSTDVAWRWYCQQSARSRGTGRRSPGEYRSNSRPAQAGPFRARQRWFATPTRTRSPWPSGRRKGSSPVLPVGGSSAKPKTGQRPLPRKKHGVTLKSAAASSLRGASLAAVGPKSISHPQGLSTAYVEIVLFFTKSYRPFVADVARYKKLARTARTIANASPGITHGRTWSLVLASKRFTSLPTLGNRPK